MKAASLSELKNELKTLNPSKLMDLCLQFAKFKKENKEFLTYLLFEASDEDNYIRGVKEMIDELYLEMNRYNLYQAKKTLRKILRETNKHIKYSGKKQTEVELLIYYCNKFKTSGIKYQSSTALLNLYNRQLLKIGKSISQLHEDLQYDFLEELKPLLD
jgi:hypothetical protein